MKTRKDILDEEREIKDEKIIRDYFIKKNGGFLYTVKEVAVKNRISVGQVYLVLKRNNAERR